jgi:hypothetical protein
VIVIGDALDTFTIATADVVQLPTPDFTVYVVVTAGETVTLAAATGNNPLLATQLNGPLPLADKTWLWPAQIVETDGVTETDGLPTVTVMTVELIHEPTDLVTVYVVVIVGVQTVTELVVVLSPVPGDHE